MDEPAESGRAADQRFGRATLQGTIIGFIVIGVMMTGGALVAGLGLAGSLGFGLFCAVLGGPGWGGMMGVTVIAARVMDTSR
jgi:hypothetical protein